MSSAVSAIEQVSARSQSCAAAGMIPAAPHMNEESTVNAADVASPAINGKQPVLSYWLQ